MVNEELPDGWHWGIGESSGNSKTYWFYTDESPAYRGQLFTDPGQPWSAVFYEETGFRYDGDVRVSEYPHREQTFESEAEALDWIRETATELIG